MLHPKTTAGPFYFFFFYFIGLLILNHYCTVCTVNLSFHDILQYFMFGSCHCCMLFSVYEDNFELCIFASCFKH